MEQRLADTEEMRKIESRFLNLFSRTFLKGALGRPGPQIQQGVKSQFQSKTFEVQIDQIIDDIYLGSCDFVDNVIKRLGLNKGGSSQASKASSKASTTRRRAAGKGGPLPITEEAVRASTELGADVSESIIRMIKDEGIYEIHPNQLANRIKDLWGGSKYRATRFTRTFTADVSQNTAVKRYAEMGIPELQFYAEIDDKTTDQCRAFHGTIFKTESADIEKYRCPLHHHCRSSLLPVTSKSRNEDLLIENRDFTQQYGQHFDALPDRVDSDIISGVFEDIDIFNEKYRIDKFILDQDIQLRLLKLDLSVVTNIPEFPTPGPGEQQKPGPEKTGLKYTPAKNNKEAEKWLLDNTSLKYADFKGVNIEITNGMNESLIDHLNISPEIAEKMDFYGTIQAQFTLEYQERIKLEVKVLTETFGETPERALAKAKARIKKRTTKAYAHFWDVKPYKYDFSGIGVNKKYGGDPVEFKKRLHYDVSVKYHPVGCDTPKSVFDHEFGHQIDNIYKLSNTSTITNIFNRMNALERRNSLSDYANKNIGEFIAEAWAEYKNNPVPRPVAKEVGDIIMSIIKKG